MPTHPLRLIFAGTPDFAAWHLQALIDCGKFNIIGVYSQPDRPAGRGKKPQASAVKQVAERCGLPVFQPLNFKTDEARQQLAELEADIMVVVAYGLILPQIVLDTPRLGCVNVHASLLPRWRGAAPIQRAIEAGDPETGVTIMQMDAGLDTGAMLSKVSCPIAPQDTSGSLHSKLAEIGAPALIRSLETLAAGAATPEIQDDSQSCYASKIDKAEAELDWHDNAAMLDRKIRAFNPFPCSYTTIGEQRLKIWQATVVDGSGLPGQILQANRDGIVVACGSRALLLLQLQLPGGRAMNAAELLNSKADLFAPGTQLGES